MKVVLTWGEGGVTKQELERDFWWAGVSLFPAYSNWHVQIVKSIKLFFIGYASVKFFLNKIHQNSNEAFS